MCVEHVPDRDFVHMCSYLYCKDSTIAASTATTSILLTSPHLYVVTNDISPSSTVSRTRGLLVRAIVLLSKVTAYLSASHLSREDLEDMLNDQTYLQAVLQTLPHVKEMNQAQIELGLANESIASKRSTIWITRMCVILNTTVIRTEPRTTGTTI
jgi:hypothetical protein